MNVEYGELENSFIPVFLKHNMHITLSRLEYVFSLALEDNTNNGFSNTDLTPLKGECAFRAHILPGLSKVLLRHLVCGCVESRKSPVF